jgi:hypothetical protein
MAAFAWSWNFEQSQRCLDLYGGQAARLIRTAPIVELLEITSQAPEEEAASETIEIAGVPMRITRRIDLSNTPGLLNARTALIDDASYDWTDQPAQSSAPGRALVRFADTNGEVLLYFNFANHRLMVLPEGRSARLVPKAASGWHAFLQRHVESAKPRDTPARLESLPSRLRAVVSSCLRARA